MSRLTSQATENVNKHFIGAAGLTSPDFGVNGKQEDDLSKSVTHLFSCFKTVWPVANTELLSCIINFSPTSDCAVSDIATEHVTKMDMC